MQRAELERRLPELTPPLRGFIGRRLPDAHAADDVLQDTLVLALRHAGELRDPAKLPAWLRAIARREADHRRLSLRQGRWAELSEAAQAAPPEQRQSMFEDFDAVARRLAAAGVAPGNIRALSLHFCFDWSVPEIAAVTRMSQGTLYTQVGRAKRHLRGAGAAQPLSNEQDLRLKLLIFLDLFHAFAFPLAGAAIRAMELLPDLESYIRLLKLQYRHFLVQYMAFLFHVSKANCRAWTDVTDMLSAPLTERRRERWDAGEMQAAREAYELFLTLRPDPPTEALMRAYAGLFLPAQPEWSGVLRQFQAAHALNPTGGPPLDMIRVMAVVQGPLDAARHLETFRRHEKVRDDPFAQLLLGRLHMDAGYRNKAIACFRKFLTWKRNPAWQDAVRELIHRCQAAKPTTKLRHRKLHN